MQISPVVKNLIIINVIVFFAVSYMFPNWHTYFEAYYPSSAMFRPVQIVTHMFMHGNLIPHLFFNMFMLYMFGSVMEYYWGGKYFLFVYLLSGLGALGFHYLVNFMEIHYFLGAVDPGDYENMLNQGRQVLLNNKYYLGDLGTINLLVNIPAVGASGAVFGITAAFATQFPRRTLMLLFPPIPMEARILIPAIIILEVFLGLGGGSGSGIAHFAHVGGAITGFILTKFRYKLNF